jgi:hypothetical protein
MDDAVSIVQLYLRLNGFMTVTEFPVIEAVGDGNARAATDLDLLAFRFAGAGQLLSVGRGASPDFRQVPPDPVLCPDPSVSEMLIGEVKEGRAELNAAATNPNVLRAALLRFGCCPVEHLSALVAELRAHGRATTRHGHRVRMLAFGSIVSSEHRNWDAISLQHVMAFLRSYVREHWDLLRHAQSKDPALGFLVLLEKTASLAREPWPANFPKTKAKVSHGRPARRR